VWADTWRRGALFKVYFFVLMKGQEQTVLAKGNLKVVREVSEVVPLCHLLLLKGTSNKASGVLIVPLAVSSDPHLILL
jgi:hypothetical protein